MKTIRNYAIPYLVFLIIILLDACFSSSKKSSLHEDKFIDKTQKKDYTAQTYYSKSMMAILDNGHTLLKHPRMINFFSPGRVDDMVYGRNTKIQVVPPNRVITIYTTKNPNRWKYLFQYNDVQGILDVTDQKNLEALFSTTQLKDELDKKLQNTLNEINNHKDIHLSICTPYRDFAFSEFTNELPNYHSDIIAKRNQQYYQYKLAELKINKFVKISGYEIRENDKNKEQCFNVITSDLKYYFISYNLID